MKTVPVGKSTDRRRATFALIHRNELVVRYLIAMSCKYNTKIKTVDSGMLLRKRDGLTLKNKTNKPLHQYKK